MIPLWPYYRVIMEGYAKAPDIDDMSIDDIDDLCDVADAYIAAGREGRR